MPFAGGWLVTCYDNGTVVKIGADGQTERVWDKDSAGAALVGPNDATSDGKGGAYLTASGPWESGPIVGKVYHLDRRRCAHGRSRTICTTPTASSSRPTASCST